MFIVGLLGILLPFLCHGLAYAFKGWLGGTKVTCVSFREGVQLILANNWARPAILVAGNTDYPPKADAGPDVILHLPVNYATLNGSLSRDDDGNLRYQWIKVTDGLQADMMGTRSSVLQLSGLELGDYTFKLEVTDTAGQSSVAYVHVFVKSAVCESSHSYSLTANRGTINSLDYEYSTCIEWMIKGPDLSNITIRFTSLHLDSVNYNYNCQKRDHIELGPLPEKMVCGPLTDANQVYSSERNHVWIKLIRSADTFYSQSKYFRLQYLVTPPCGTDDFICDNGKCIYHDWRCNGANECGDWSDEINCNILKRKPTTSPPSPIKLSSHCNYDEIYCWVETLHGFYCLHNIYKCDGTKDCDRGEDEQNCGDASCNRRLEQYIGWFTSPNYPQSYPNNKHCSWEIHVTGVDPQSHIQLRFITFSLQRDKMSDYVEVYDGPNETYELIGRYDGNSFPPDIIESTQSWMLVKFISDSFASFSGFNATYQVKGYCLPGQLPCGGPERDCYDNSNRCDEYGFWDCPETGADERLCRNCQANEFSCGSRTAQCYVASERCNGVAKCSNNADEENCNPKLCGPVNGTFLCDNNRCIYESWTCDHRDDCGDYSDEKNCSGSSRRVIIAAISGSVICALLLTILIGCSCKLYSLRTIERHGGLRHHSPMSRLYAEFLRRTAPPPYHEAMLTSRNYDEVQQEQRERLQALRRGRRSNGSRSNISQNNQISSDTQTADNTAANPNTAERDNMNFVNEVEVTESGDNPDVVPQTTENSGVSLDRSNEATEDQNSDSETDSDSSGDEEENAVNNVITPDGIELQATSLSSRIENLDDDAGSSDDSCILTHHSDCDGTSQNIDNQSISLDDISMETASASINLELTDTGEITNLENVEESDKDLDCEQENLINTRRDSEPKDDSGEMTVISGSSHLRNSQESLNSINSNSTADSDEPLLVA